MRHPFGNIFLSAKSYSHYIEYTFMAAIWFSSSTPEKTLGCTDNPLLLFPVHTFLRWCLHVFAAGLHLYKMYSIHRKRDYIDFKMAAAPISFQDSVTHSFEQSACNIFSFSS